MILRRGETLTESASGTSSGHVGVDGGRGDIPAHAGGPSSFGVTYAVMTTFSDSLAALRLAVAVAPEAWAPEPGNGCARCATLKPKGLARDRAFCNIKCCFVWVHSRLGHTLQPLPGVATSAPFALGIPVR